jgi:hypothetical protein
VKHTGKPVWFVPQAFGNQEGIVREPSRCAKRPVFAPFHCSKMMLLPRQAQDKHREKLRRKERRDLCRGEVRAMSYESILAGATGLYFFTREDVDKTPP